MENNTMKSELNNRRISFFVLICALLGGLIGAIIGYAIYSPKWMKGPKHHCSDNRNPLGYKTPGLAIAPNYVARVIYLGTNNTIANFDIVVDGINAQHIPVTTPLYGYAAYDTLFEVPGLISSPITQVRIYHKGDFIAGRPPLATYMPATDAYWADDQIGNTGFYIAWNPTSQAIVIMDANLNGILLHDQ
jgi:hypothetical protein